MKHIPTTGRQGRLGQQPARGAALGACAPWDCRPAAVRFALAICEWDLSMAALPSSWHAAAAAVQYNAASGLCYATKYEGRDRGVLVQLGQRQLGHLPLGLHDEGMARPPPTALG